MNLTLSLGISPYNRPVLWTDPVNPHISVTGQSGSGKSYFLRGLLEQAAAAGASCIVFDYTSDFRTYTPPEGIPVRRFEVGRPGFSLNPLVGVGDDEAELIVQRLLAAIHSVFRLGSKGSMALREAALFYLDCTKTPTLRGLAGLLRDMKQTPGLLAAREPLELLASLLPCGEERLTLDLDTPGLTILGFERFLDRELRSAAIELILSAIWDVWTLRTGHAHPLILLMDEAQNLGWQRDSMAVRILREGRKHELAGWFATQWVDKPEIVRALGQAALQAHFRPDDRGIFSLARLLGHENPEQTAQFRALLHSLKRGQFILQPPDGKSVLVRVPPRP